MCREIYEHDPTRFLTAQGLAWQAALKNIKVRLDLLIDIDMLLLVDKSITGGICCSICRYTQANSKYMKNSNKNEESSYLQYWDVNNLYVWTMLQKGLVKIKDQR